MHNNFEDWINDLPLQTLTDDLKQTIIEEFEHFSQDNPVPSLDNRDIKIISNALIACNYKEKNRLLLLQKLQNGVENAKVQLKYCEFCTSKKEETCKINCNF